MATLNEDQLSDIQNELKTANTEKSIAALLHKFAFDEFGIIDTASILEDECVCESCAEPRSFAPETIEEMEMIQYCWLELRQYIRLIYRLTMKGSLKSIDNYYQDYMKDIVSRLVEICDAHQIFLRLEAQVKEFIVEIKVLLLQILDRMAEKPKLPQLFLTGLMDRYSKVMSAASVIAPVLKRLEEEHLQKFSLTWKILNQRLFQTIIYSDVFFQNSVPLFLSQIGKPSGSEENKKLLKEFLKFDKELGNVEGSWVDIEANIAHYLQQRPSLSEKKKILIHDCEAFKVAKHKAENIPVLENTAPGYPPPNGINMDDIQTINIDGAETEVLTGTCECHVCLDPSGHTPVDFRDPEYPQEGPPDRMSPYDQSAPNEVELIEQVIPLNPHRSGFHLYPHIHGTHRDFGSFLPKECQLPEYCGKITEQQLWDGSFAKGMNKLNKMEHPFHHHHHHHHHLHPLPKHHPGHPIKKRMDKATQKDQEVVQTQTIEGKVKVENRKPTSGERVDKATQKDQDVGHTNNGKVRKTAPGVTHNHAHLKDADSHHIHCSKHSDVKRVPFPEGEEGHTVDDSHSENSQSDPRHCDCCYCEVFGHGLPSAAPMSRNYQEMRERLRLLLNKKKSKCKSNTVSPHQTAQKKQQTPGAPPPPANPERDTRALEDLLDFIEGNEVKCRNEKKAAKKARQKEKKRILLNRKKREEEEKARLLEQQRKREEALAKKREEALAKEAEERARANNKSKKKNSKSNHENNKANHNNNSNNNSSNADKNNTQKKPGPQMVTIKRVMEPHNSEPTVTITLRGATPNQDRVLYTLLNGQVCKVKDVPNDKKSMNSGKSNPGKNNSSNPVNSKIKETPVDKGKLKKEKIFTDSSLPKVPNIKPVKELTNPTSIQINNAINSLSKKPSQPFNIADIKLPPGITITKVDPSTVQTRTHKIQETNTKKNNASQIRPSSEVIVVSTGKRKDQPALSKEPLTDNQNGKKKKNKKKSAASAAVIATNGKGSSYPGLEIQPIKIVDAEKDKDLANRMSVLTISPYADNNIEKNDVSKKKKKRSKKSPPSDINNEEWKLLDSVFAPKDIDLDDGEMDDAERELEAFKRFCLQSIPPERKEKVHLNIKDIVLKKKSASYDY